ncbi:hypothetical protein IWQ61_006908 [Dispira simplex]|nr:hypothetical protein IWQ61_006908 [Dispira simplex]
MPSGLLGATLSLLLTHMWSLIPTITVFMESLTRYPIVMNDDTQQAKKLWEFAQRKQTKDGSSSESSDWTNEASQQLIKVEVTQRLANIQMQYPFVFKWWADISNWITDCWCQHADLMQQCLGFLCWFHWEPKSEGQSKLAILFALSTLMQFEVLLVLTNLAGTGVPLEATSEITPTSTSLYQSDVYDVDIQTYIAMVCGALAYLATQCAASDALVILTSEPISAEALVYHPRGPVALVELLGVECDPTKGLVSQVSTHPVGQGYYIGAGTTFIDVNLGLVHQVLERWNTIMMVLLTHMDVVQQ